ncbi:accessory Sec system protein Asp1 [Streptococcus loxodontisalivarius]|uniref:Accessory secretory protein Asp1 n=1 Tax=Streptococcus loxodontisalivarius TaxID=1349415 RepID=A0ABS2PTX5_9STRE|nr:accessory secretory protein Asp1 [Streptococcus loxodontisalivarius]
MFYFIPSWYNQNRPWYDETPLWFRVFERMTFDDTINQLKMFRQSQEDVSLLILNYQPQLRYFMHKQDVVGTDYWSFFDDIQNIQLQTTDSISFKDLNWPEGTRFVYSPFAVLAMRGQELLAYIHFAENGNLHHIEFVANGKAKHRYVFDDRGFVSSILYFNEDGHEAYQDYLNQNGVWQVREFLGGNNRLLINPLSDKNFKQEEYQSWEELLTERLALLQEGMSQDDCLVIASDRQHNHLLESVFPEQKKVLSFFNKRYSLTESDDLKQSLSQADLVVVDTESQEKALLDMIEKLGVDNAKMTRLSSFDTRLRLGHSQTIKELIIYFYIDTISEAELDQALMTLLDVMDNNPLVNLRMISFNTGLNKDGLNQNIAAKIQKYFDPENFYTNAEALGENNLEEDEELENYRVQIETFTNENQIISALDTARLVLDLGQEPDLYTQIASISAGVPQINQVTSDYVSHQENGWILEDLTELNQAIGYYFDGLANWNASLVYAVQKMGDYTSGRLLTEWKTLLEN